MLESMAKKVVKKFMLISDAYIRKPVADGRDGVHSYARVLCPFASVVFLFVDAWKEGHGEHIIRLWKMCMFSLLC